ILKLAAIDVMANATEEQTLALQGGHYLSNEAFSMVSPWIVPQEASVEAILATSAANRLTKRMALWLTNLIVNRGQALAFVVALCVHAEMVIKAASLPLSNVLVIYDREIERVYQLFHLLRSNLKPEKYAKLIPGPHTLVSQYGLSWGLAILWGRPSVAIHLKQGLKQWEEEGEKIHVDIVELDEDDGAGVGGEASPEDGSATDPSHANQPPGKEDPAALGPSRNASPSHQNQTLAKSASTDPAMDVDEGARVQAKDGMPRLVANLKFEAPLLPRDFVDHIARTLSPQALAAGLSPEFVAVFWALTSYDIEVPKERYKKEIDAQNTFIKR
ncbi:THO2 plays a role in transcriptional elongation, partial [Coemansia furcata]